MIKDAFKNGVSAKKELILTWFALLTTFAMACYFCVSISVSSPLGGVSFTFTDAFICLFLLFIAFSNGMSLMMRKGYFQRLKNHHPLQEETLEDSFVVEAPSLTFLVPSYKEDVAMVRQTLYSLALQDYPNRRIVLLIDDPPLSTKQEDREMLEKTRALPGEVESLLSAKLSKLQNGYQRYLQRAENQKVNFDQEWEHLALLHDEVAAWFEKMAKGYPVKNHTDTFFVEQTFLSRAAKHRRRSKEASQGIWSAERIEKEFRYLAALFKVEVTSFERKRYDNLSHAPNKAMNINSYISVMGKRLVETINDEGALLLEEVEGQEADFVVSSSKYLGMVDADTIISYDYSSRLVHLMESEGEERTALAQSYFTAVPNPSITLERIAGSTTDLNYIYHQGMTAYNATSWMGTNAIIRFEALQEIASEIEERGYGVMKYIQDRTVVEDTETTVDFVSKNWQLYNYPERLAFSNTPADFGALLIQRGRWANGGILLMPKLLKHIFRWPWELKRFIEGGIRAFYISSLTFVVTSLLLMCAMRVERNATLILWSLIFSLPYFILCARDLHHMGFRFFDFIRGIALNCVLLPVNIGGVFKSWQQAVSGNQIPFRRTPKIENRTALPCFFALIEAFLVLQALVMSATFFLWSDWVEVLLSCLIFHIPVIYGYMVYLGLKNNCEDILPIYEKIRGWIPSKKTALLSEILPFEREEAKEN